MSIGDLIKSIRLSLKWRQEDLAEKIGVDPATIRKYENGALTPKGSTRIKIAQAFSVEPGMLLNNWDDEIDIDLFKLIMLFDTYGGRFKEIDGTTYITFEQLDKELSDWAVGYGVLMEKFTRAKHSGDAAGASKTLLEYFKGISRFKVEPIKSNKTPSPESPLTVRAAVNEILSDKYFLRKGQK